MKQSLSLILSVLIGTIFTVILPQVVFANPVNSDSDVTASVPTTDFYGPNLISPPNNHTSNSARFTFVWRRPSPLPTSTLDHYDLFIDDAIFAANVPDSLTSQDFYFYTATGSSGYFYIALKQDLTQGYHTWRVAVYDNLGQNTATGNWNFYIDSIAPFISLTQINSQNYTWNTAVTGSIPEEANRYLNVSSNNPTLKGNVETGANLQVSLICPTPIPQGCSNQSWIINSADGKWEKQFSNLTSNVYYSVYLAATDATNNSTIFPTFYLRYQTGSVTATPTTSTTPTTTATPTMTPLPTLEPSQIPLPSASLSLTPPPDLAAQVTPTPFTSKPPPAPTVPPRKQAAVVEDLNYLNLILLIFLIIGLPTHLLLNIIGQGIASSFIIKFLFALLYPFLRPKNTQTRPFTTITLYEPENLKRPVLRAVSDIRGWYYLPKNLPNKLFVSAKKITSNWKDQIMAKNNLMGTCLNPITKKYLSNKEQLQNYLYDLRIIPLIVAIVTSGLSLYFAPSLYSKIYLYLSLQAGFSQYLYPKIKDK